METNKPLAHRDFPPGCFPAPLHPGPIPQGAVQVLQQQQQGATATGRRSRSPRPFNEGRIPRTPSLPRPSIDSVWNFVVDPNDTPEELYSKRRKRYAALLRYFQQMHECGELVGRSRPDLEAAKRMTEDKQVSNWKGIGHVPGSVVGDFFYYRSELYILGMHRAIQAGIAYVNENGQKIGCSVVASGGYEDDKDEGETFFYTGCGGSDKVTKRQVRDQIPEGGNLALQNSCYRQQPVRVIRGHSDIATIQSPSKRLYSYDGLYNVVQEGVVLGNAGFKVFQFKLERLPDQTELGSRLVSFVGKLNKAPTERTGLLIADISDGQEPIPVGVVNTVDNSSLPSSFQYTTKLMYDKGIVLPTRPSSQCTCIDPFPCHAVGHSCSCIARNTGRVLPYNQYGLLIRAVPAVYECGRLCRCPMDCHSRVCQKGLRYRLEIFKTENKGWGVRSWDFIPSGGFVCEYTGEVMDTKTADELEDDEYLFNLDMKQGNEARWGDKLTDVVTDVPGPGALDTKPKYVIDASKFGGVARFINHSCKPNLFVQCVLYDDCDLDIPHVMLFAGREIRPFQELTYDYGYALDSVFDASGNPKMRACYCDARNCRKRLY